MTLLRKAPCPLPKPHPVNVDEHTDSVQQVANHMKTLFKRQNTSSPHSLSLPSVVELAACYRCSLLLVLKALSELEKQGFKYRLTSIDTNILLTDSRNLYSTWH